MRASVDEEAAPGMREPEPPLAARVPAALVIDRRPREEHRVPAETPRAQREIGVFEIQLEARVETVQLLEQKAADHQERARHVIHLARVAVVPPDHAETAKA